MKVIPLALPDVLLIEPKVFADERGFFFETYHAERYRQFGIEETFVQDNHSRSRRGSVRGLHFQLRRPQAKLVRVTRGAVFDVAVDIRPNSPDFGRWVGVVLDDDNKRQLYVPKGFAHGFCTLSETADFEYKCSDFYDPADEYGIAWNDSDIAVDWPQMEQVVLSPRDRRNPTLAQVLETVLTPDVDFLF